MREIELRQVTIHNFKSYIAPTTVSFTNSPGTRFLSGANLTNARLGANGAGKSALFDAIFWCFYGTSIRDKRSSELLSAGQQTMSVEVQIAVDGEPKSVYRFYPPNRIEIDHLPTTQDDVDRLLGLAKTQFKQAVIFGQGVPLFYDQSSPDRGALLDDILDLDLWLKLAELAGKESRAIETDLTKLRTEKARLEGFLAALDTEALRAQAVAWDKQTQQTAEAMFGELEALEREKQANSQRITDLEAKITPAADSTDTSQLEESVRQRYGAIHLQQAKKEEICRLLRLYQDHAICPNCCQPLSPEFVTDKLRGLKSDLVDVTDFLQTAQRETGVEMAALAEIKQTARAAEAQRVAARADLAELRAEEKGIERDIRRLTIQVQATLDQENPYAAEIAAMEQKAAIARDDLALRGTTIDWQQSKQARVDYWKEGFRKIRLFLVRQTLQLIEVTAANVASAFGLGSWTIKLTTEQETKSGSVRPGIHLALYEGESLTPREFSPGEEQRIRLAVALGLGAVIEQLAGVHWRLQVWDEPSNWLATEGIEDLLALLAYRAESEDKVGWIIDHRALVHAGFSEIWQVTKDGDGSRIARLATTE